MSAPSAAARSKSSRELETPQARSVTSSLPTTWSPGWRELGPALHFEQRIRVGDDLVPPGHAQSLEA